jgi:hypothetical protein
VRSRPSVRHHRASTAAFGVDFSRIPPDILLDVLEPRAETLCKLPIVGPRGLTSGQLSYDRSQHVSEVGAEDEIGEANLLSSPLDFLSGGRRVIR